MSVLEAKSLMIPILISFAFLRFLAVQTEFHDQQQILWYLRVPISLTWEDSTLRCAHLMKGKRLYPTGTCTVYSLHWIGDLTSTVLHNSQSSIYYTPNRQPKLNNIQIPKTHFSSSFAVFNHSLTTTIWKVSN